MGGRLLQVGRRPSPARSTKGSSSFGLPGARSPDRGCLPAVRTLRLEVFMRPVRLARAALAVATAGTVLALTWTPAGAVSASPGFTCARDLQQACAIVFAPLCSKHPCY